MERDGGQDGRGGRGGEEEEDRRRRRRRRWTSNNIQTTELDKMKRYKGDMERGRETHREDEREHR